MRGFGYNRGLLDLSDAGQRQKRNRFDAPRNWRDQKQVHHCFDPSFGLPTVAQQRAVNLKRQKMRSLQASLRKRHVYMDYLGKQLIHWPPN